MVGIGPDENGWFSPTAVEQLRSVGRWLKINGEGIYATRAREGELWHEGDNVRFTRSKDNKTVYAHCLHWPGNQLTLKTIQPQKGAEIFLLGNKKPLKWEINLANELVISIPEGIGKVMHEDEQLAFTFKIENL